MSVRCCKLYLIIPLWLVILTPPTAALLLKNHKDRPALRNDQLLEPKQEYRKSASPLNTPLATPAPRELLLDWLLSVNIFTVIALFIAFLSPGLAIPVAVLALVIDMLLLLTKRENTYVVNLNPFKESRVLLDLNNLSGMKQAISKPIGKKLLMRTKHRFKRYIATRDVALKGKLTKRRLNELTRDYFKTMYHKDNESFKYKVKLMVDMVYPMRNELAKLIRKRINK